MVTHLNPFSLNQTAQAGHCTEVSFGNELDERGKTRRPITARLGKFGVVRFDNDHEWVDAQRVYKVERLLQHVTHQKRHFRFAKQLVQQKTYVLYHQNL